MSSSISRAARAIRQQDRDTANYKVREVEYADVRRVNPLGLDLHDSSITLDEDDLTLSRWVQVYDDNAGIKVGDRLAVKRMRTGGWLATDVVGGPDAGSFTTGGTVGDGTVTTAKLADNAVTSAKIADDAVGASEVATGAIGTSEIADNAVTSAKIADGTIVNADVAASAAIAESKLTLASDAAAGTASRRTLGTGATQACAGNDSRLSDSRTPSGSAGGDLTGTYPNPTLANDSVTADKLRDDASTDANRAVTTNHLRDSSVTTAKIASNAVTSAKIATDAVGSAQIADGSVTSAEIADGTITNSDVSATAAIAESKLSLASDAAAGTASRRSLGTSSTQACAGNDSRLSDSRTPTGSAGGDLSGTYPNPTLATGAVSTAEIADRAVTGAKTSTVTETKTAAATTPVTADNGKLLLMDRSTDQTVTIDGDLNLSTGDRIDFIRIGTGNVTFQQGTGATLNGTPGLKLRAQYSGASIVCVGTDSYIAIGDLSA